MSGKVPIPSLAALPPGTGARERILTAAVELLHTEGFASLTQQAVAVRAGVRQSHLTYYFPTRIDLLTATAQFGVEVLCDPLAMGADSGEVSVEALRAALLPDRSDRQWFRLMTGLMIASDEDASIKSWLHEFDARVTEKIGAGFAAVGLHVTPDQLHFLHATFIGALHLDMQESSDASLARARRIIETALHAVITSARPIDCKPRIKPRKSAS